MGILGIENRTENWKTVQHFYGIDDRARFSIVRRLLKPSGQKPEFQPNDIEVELFWFGMRDYMELLRRKEEDVPTSRELADVYSGKDLFYDLRQRVQEFIESPGKHTYKFRTLKCHNYAVGSSVQVPKRDGRTISAPEELKNNLAHTEIDIVLRTPKHLFIGEAKDESSFNAPSKYVLVHQLVRQYVTAKILVHLIHLNGQSLEVIPFVVGDAEKLASIKNTSQVNFMQNQGWLKEKNILSWDDIKKLGKGDS